MKAFFLLLLMVAGAAWAADPLRIDRGDTLPVYPAVVRSAGGAYNLTGCSVEFFMIDADGNSILANKTATIVSASKGQIEYRWADGDTNTPGAYTVKFRVTTQDSKRFTQPVDGSHRVIIY